MNILLFIICILCAPCSVLPMEVEGKAEQHRGFEPSRKPMSYWEGLKEANLRDIKEWEKKKPEYSKLDNLDKVRDAQAELKRASDYLESDRQWALKEQTDANKELFEKLNAVISYRNHQLSHAKANLENIENGLKEPDKKEGYIKKNERIDKGYEELYAKSKTALKEKYDIDLSKLFEKPILSKDGGAVDSRKTAIQDYTSFSVEELAKERKKLFDEKLSIEQSEVKNESQIARLKQVEENLRKISQQMKSEVRDESQEKKVSKIESKDGVRKTDAFGKEIKSSFEKPVERVKEIEKDRSVGISVTDIKELSGSVYDFSIAALHSLDKIAETEDVNTKKELVSTFNEVFSDWKRNHLKDTEVQAWYDKQEVELVEKAFLRVSEPDRPQKTIKEFTKIYNAINATDMQGVRDQYTVLSVALSELENFGYESRVAGDTDALYNKRIVRNAKIIDALKSLKDLANQLQANIQEYLPEDEKIESLRTIEALTGKISARAKAIKAGQFKAFDITNISDKNHYNTMMLNLNGKIPQDQLRTVAEFITFKFESLSEQDRRVLKDVLESEQLKDINKAERDALLQILKEYKQLTEQQGWDALFSQSYRAAQGLFKEALYQAFEWGVKPAGKYLWNNYLQEAFVRKIMVDRFYLRLKPKAQAEVKDFVQFVQDISNATEEWRNNTIEKYTTAFNNFKESTQELLKGTDAVAERTRQELKSLKILVDGAKTIGFMVGLDAQKLEQLSSVLKIIDKVSQKGGKKVGDVSKQLEAITKDDVKKIITSLVTQASTITQQVQVMVNIFLERIEKDGVKSAVTPTTAVKSVIKAGKIFADKEGNLGTVMVQVVKDVIQESEKREKGITDKKLESFSAASEKQESKQEQKQASAEVAPSPKKITKFEKLKQWFADAKEAFIKKMREVRRKFVSIEKDYAKAHKELFATIGVEAGQENGKDYVLGKLQAALSDRNKVGKTKILLDKLMQLSSERIQESMRGEALFDDFTQETAGIIAFIDIGSVGQGTDLPMVDIVNQRYDVVKDLLGGIKEVQKELKNESFDDAALNKLSSQLIKNHQLFEQEFQKVLYQKVSVKVIDDAAQFFIKDGSIAITPAELPEVQQFIDNLDWVLQRIPKDQEGDGLRQVLVDKLSFKRDEGDGRFTTNLQNFARELISQLRIIERRALKAPHDTLFNQLFLSVEAPLKKVGVVFDKVYEQVGLNAAQRNSLTQEQIDEALKKYSSPVQPPAVRQAEYVLRNPIAREDYNALLTDYEVLKAQNIEPKDFTQQKAQTLLKEGATEKLKLNASQQTALSDAVGKLDSISGILPSDK